MKVTALIPDQLIDEAKTLSGGKTITEALVIALSEWIAMKKIHELTAKVKKNPLKFKATFSSYRIRKVNRNR